MLIHWIKDKKKQNPTTVAEIISMLQMGSISESTLAWHKGCSEWLPLKQLPALQSFFNPHSIPETEEPTSDPLPQTDGEVKSETETAPEPQAAENLAKDLQDKLKNNTLVMLKMPSAFQRFLARMLDLTLYGFIYMLIINWRAIPYSQGLELTNPFLWLPFIPLEAAIISHFRTTPGKALLGIRIYSLKGQEGLNFLACLRRSFLVFALGLGMMLVPPPIPLFLIALGLSYHKLKKQGFTSWDERCQTVVLQRDKPHAFKPFLAGFLTFYIFLSTLNLMEPWLPAMFESISEQSPEAAQKLDEIKEMMPVEIQNAWPTETTNTPSKAQK